jgi:hypothetical protein
VKSNLRTRKTTAQKSSDALVRNLHWVVSQHGPDVHSSATALTLVLPGQTCMQAQFEPLHAHTLPPPQPVSPEHMLISDWVLHAPQADTTNIAITAAKQIIAPAESPRQENSISSKRLYNRLKVHIYINIRSK